MGGVLDRVRQARADALADCPNYPDHVSSGHALRLAEAVDPLLMYVGDLASAVQALADAINMTDAPAAPCEECLVDEEVAAASPGTAYGYKIGALYHPDACKCPCHRTRVEHVEAQFHRATRYAEQALKGLAATPHPGVVGHLTACLHSHAAAARVDRVGLERMVEWLAVTDAQFRAMLTTLCEAAVDQVKRFGTPERAEAARRLTAEQAFLKEACRGATFIPEGGRAAGPGGDAGGG